MCLQVIIYLYSSLPVLLYMKLYVINVLLIVDVTYFLYLNVLESIKSEFMYFWLLYVYVKVLMIIKEINLDEAGTGQNNTNADFISE